MKLEAYRWRGRVDAVELCIVAVSGDAALLGLPEEYGGPAWAAAASINRAVRPACDQVVLAGLDRRWQRILLGRRVECRIGSHHLCFERSAPARRRCRNSRAQLVTLFRPMLTQMCVGGVMACTHADAPLSKRISPTFRQLFTSAHWALPILSEGRSLETLPVGEWAGPPSHDRRAV